MYFSERITLRSVASAPDGFGDLIPTYTDTEVWADKKSTTRSEFYSANMAGIKADAVFSVHVEDYNNQEVVLYGTRQYTVVRSYQNGEGVVELTCAVREVV